MLLDDAIVALRGRKDDWVRLPVRPRITLLEQCLDRYLHVAADVVARGCEAKGNDATRSGEDWMSGPLAVIRQLRLLMRTLGEIERYGRPRLPDGAVHRTATGELAVTVFPRGRAERLMYPGTRIDVWMQPGLDEATVVDTMASSYRGPRPAGKVVAVLGAGNVASIGPTDVLHKLFVEHAVVVLKMHPVNDYLGPLLEDAFAPLITAGYLRIVYGDAAEGQALVHHPGVDEVHMTGSLATHDRIVWGDTLEEQGERRAAGRPKLAKRITSELGCVTPVIVAPGRWSDAELRYQAENVASMVAHGASCTCVAAKVLVTWSGWPQRQTFLDGVADVLRGERRTIYYPGSVERYAQFLAAYPQARCLGENDGREHSCATIFGLDPGAAEHLAFRTEAWSPLLAETALDADGEAGFLSEAVRFCNERISGTLTAHLLVSPDARQLLRDDVDRAVAALRYGTVAINHWSGMSFVLGDAPWGAWPGHTLEDAGSGIGWVHNPLMFDRPLKTVLWGPFTSWPKPPWFVTHRHAHVVARRAARFEAAPSPWRLAGIVTAAIRG